MSNDRLDAPLDPLSEALRVYLEHRAGGTESDAELLRRHPALRELLEPLLDEVGPSLGELRPGVVLGDFRLIEAIGRGGMGEVWEAEQLSLHRRVALKLLRAEHFTNARAVERFRREALAGARLKHPGIVAVHAVGEVAGVHYIAQELIETRRTLSHALREAREANSVAPQHWRDTARRFEQISGALQLAHDAGVIHRDIKPSNILLAAEGRPMVADFGLALVAGESDLSRTGDLSGSPFYMSPEQASSVRTPIDARSDVFSLGATLFEALTLQRPFEGDTLAQVLHKILHDDPPDPREIRSLCPRDLAVICLKMLEKDPDRRYASMREVGDELQRFLRDEPIHARPPGAVDAAVKWCRRHPVRAASSAIVCVALAVVSLLLFENQRARNAAEKAAIAERASSKEARLEARTSSRIVDFLIDAFVESTPESTRGREVSAREVLDRGVKKVRTGLTDPAESGPRARLLGSLGMVHSRLGLHPAAIELLREAQSLADLSFGATDPRSLEIRLELGRTYTGANRLEEARKLFAEAHAAYVERSGGESLAALKAESSLGSLLMKMGELQPAERHLRHCLAGLRALGERSGNVAFTLSEILRSQGNFEESRKLLEESLHEYRVRDGADHPDTLNVLEGLVRHEAQSRRFDEAEALLREVADARLCVQGPRHRDTIVSQSRVASADMRTDPERGLIELRRLMALALEEFGAEDPATGQVAKQLGSLLAAMERDAEAEEALTVALTSLAAQGNSSPFERIAVLCHLGLVERHAGRKELALSIFEEALDIGLSGRAPHPFVIEIGLRNALDLRGELGQYEAALETAREWLKRASPEHPEREAVEAAAKEFELRIAGQ